jgi:hypothetical protein
MTALCFLNLYILLTGQYSRLFRRTLWSLIKTLGEYLGEMIKEEFLKNNSQIAKMIKEKIPFNIYMVGHSMGGLVARAGLRNFDSSPEIWNNFKQLITWGTPHQGSPLVTLRYIAAAGFDIKVDDLPFYPYGNLPKKVLGQLAMDTPGNQDLRWTGGSAGIQKFFNFDMFFRENSVEQFEGKEWDLRGGSMFYNDNLRTFNENEKHSDKLTTLYGTTSKTADVRKEGLIFKAWHFYHSSELGQGAYLIRLLAGSDELKASDGAVPVYSQTGRGLFPMPSSISMGDCDHEQFFGAMGTETAEKTFEVMNNAAKCDCPTIDDYKFKNDSIGAKLKLPMDSKPGDRIKKIKVELEDKKTNDKEEPSVDFEILSNGKFNGELGMDKNDIEKKTVSLVMTFKDESEITYEGSNVLLEGKWNVRGIIEKLVIYTGDEEPTLKGTSTGEHMVDFYQIMEQGFTTKKDGDYIICAPPNADKPNAMYTKYRIKFTSGDEFTGTKTMKGTMNTLQIENITGKRIK